MNRKCNNLDFFNKHIYPNEINICKVCNKKTECEVKCSCPKDKTILFICKECIEKDRAEQKIVMEKLVDNWKWN